MQIVNGMYIVKDINPIFYNVEDCKKKLFSTDIKEKKLISISLLVPTFYPKRLSFWDKIIGRSLRDKQIVKINFKKNDYLSLSIEGFIATIFTNNENDLKKLEGIDEDFVKLFYHFDVDKRFSIKTNIENIEEIIIKE